MTRRYSAGRATALRWAVCLAVILLLAACGGSTSKAPAGTAAAVSSGAGAGLAGLPKNKDGYADVSVQQLADSLPAKNYTLVNVHIPYEGELPQTDLAIPYDQIAQQIGRLPDKGAPILLYCRSGRMSTIAAQTLVKLGYTNVMELDGGMVAWESSGRQLLQKQ